MLSIGKWIAGNLAKPFKYGRFSVTIALHTMRWPVTIGVSAPRKEGRDKVTGRARYIDDITLPNMLYGATVRSQFPRGKIKKITFGDGIHWDEFVIVTAKDIPGKNYIALIEYDQPCLADGVVNHPEEPILLLAHPDDTPCRRAVARLKSRYEPLPPIFTIEESERKTPIIWGADNIFKTYLIQKGDVESVWENADYIVEGEYFTGAQEQLYIETNGVIATFDAEHGVTVWGSLQCPYYVHKALMSLFRLCRKTKFAWCRRKPAAHLAARKNIRR